MYSGPERRKGNKMSSDFEPKTAFEGYVFANMENMKEQLKNLPCPESFKRIGKCENDISNIKGKATVFGAVFGFIGGVITKLFLIK